MIVNKVAQNTIASLEQGIKYQILTHCFFKNISINDSDLDCLLLLSKNKNISISDFCQLAVKNNVFKSTQSARNSVNKAEKKGLVVKMNNTKKAIALSDSITLSTEAPLLIDIKVLCKE